jgi:acetate kinase
MYVEKQRLYEKFVCKMLMKLTIGQVISKENASPLVLVIPTNEELVIASETLKEIL